MYFPFTWILHVRNRSTESAYKTCTAYLVCQMRYMFCIQIASSFPALSRHARTETRPPACWFCKQACMGELSRSITVPFGYRFQKYVDARHIADTLNLQKAGLSAFTILVLFLVSSCSRGFLFTINPVSGRRNDQHFFQ